MIEIKIKWCHLIVTHLLTTPPCTPHLLFRVFPPPVCLLDMLFLTGRCFDTLIGLLQNSPLWSVTATENKSRAKIWYQVRSPVQQSPGWDGEVLKVFKA